MWLHCTAIWHYRLVSSLQYSPEFALALGFDHEPSAAALLSAEGWLVQVNNCVFVWFACDPHTSSREEGGVLVTPCVVTQSIFQTYACCMDTFYTFIQGHEKPSDCLGADQKSTEFL